MVNSEKIMTGLIIVVVIIAVFSLFYASKFMFFPKEEAQGTQEQTDHSSSVSFTAFDVQLAKRLMDKDNDGKCDSCGMDVEFCIQSGQLECTMVPGAKIGILGSQHIHADWKIYIDGKALDFYDKSHMERMRNNMPVSSFIHVDSDSPAPEKTGDILHMHASGVPLWIFFESVGMKFDKECFALDDGRSYCNNATNRLRFYVNGKENSEYENYVFKGNDRILISYGNENEEEIRQQLSSITDFSKNH